MIQEFSEDFASYLEDQELDPIEMTMDKNDKKKLNATLDGSPGGVEQFFEMHEEGAVYPAPVESETDTQTQTVEIYGARRRPHPATSGRQRALLPPPRVDVELDLELDQERGKRMYRFLPVDMEMTWLCQLLKEYEATSEMSRDHYCPSLHPKCALLPQLGRGGRNMRWTAVMVAEGKWRWLEQGVTATWYKEARNHLAVIVIYRWPEASGLT